MTMFNETVSISIWASTNIFLSIFGILLNVSILVLCVKNVREHSYVWFVLSLSSAEIFAGSQAIIMSQPSLDDTLCTLTAAIGVISVGAAITSHPLLATNRYIAIKKSIWYPKIFDKKIIIALALSLGWLIGGAFCFIDYTAGCLDRRVDAQELACFFNPVGRIQCVLPKVIHFLSCYAIMGFCYGEIYVSLRRHQKELAHSGVINSSLASDKQLLKLMALHALVPIFVYMPALAITVVFPELKEKYSFLGNFTLSLFVIETILDAILTLFLVKIFRSAVISVIRYVIIVVTCRKFETNEVVPLVSVTSIQVVSARAPSSNV